MVSTFININGKIIAVTNAGIAPDNRAFRYGYGLFETMLVTNGNIALREYHWQRLFQSMGELCFEIPSLFTPAFLEQQVLHTVQRNNMESLCRVRLQVYAGSGGILETSYPRPEFVIECFPITPQLLELNEAGLVTGVAIGLHKSPDRLAGLKSSNALVYAMAAQQAKAAKWNDAFVTNTSGHIIESTIANIFWMKDGVAYTPPLSEGCIAGIMRRYLLQNLPGAGIRTAELPLTTEILKQADAVFLTNAVRRIKWVREIGSHTYSPDAVIPVYQAISRLLR